MSSARGGVRLFRRFLDRDDALLKHSVIMLTASGLGGVADYLYQVLMGRMLGPEDYGIFGALFSLAYVLTVPARSIELSTAKLVNTLQAAGRADDLGFVLRHRTRQVALGSGVGLLSMVAASGLIARLLRLPSGIPVMVLGLAFLAKLLVPVFMGAMLGLQRFRGLGVSNIMSALGKLAFGVVLVLLGLGVEGAVAGMAFGPSLWIVLAVWLFLADVLRRPAADRTIPRASGYAVSVLLAYLCLTLLHNVDVVLVRRLFDPTQAGCYVAASTLAKVVLFSSMAIAGAMFPKVSAAHESSEEDNKLLRAALAYAGVLAGLAAAVLSLLAGAIVPALYGADYGLSVGLVGPFSLGMVFFSLSYVLAMYWLARNRSGFVLLLGVAVVAEVAGILLLHETLLQVVVVFTAIMAAVLVGMGALSLKWAGPGIRRRLSRERE
jgi:O-antigen/teichoic acid export membrane protein